MWIAFEADRFDNPSFGILADSGLGILLTRRTCWVFCVAHGERGDNRRQVYQKLQICAFASVRLLLLFSSLQQLIQDL